MSRWIALSISSVVSLLALWLFLELRSPHAPDVTLMEADVEGARAARDALADREPKMDSTSPPAPAEVDAEPWTAFPYHVPPESASKLFPQLRVSTTRYDEWCGYVYEPGIVTGKKFAEHPSGEYSKRANSLGIRSEREPLEFPPSLRVLVAGDSHVDGVCNAPEGYPALLEERLAGRLGESVEVLNTGHGGYTFYNYVGVLERFLHLDLRPDVFVVTIFCGNDFTENLALTRFFSTVKMKHPPNPRYRLHVDRQRAAKGRMRAALAQGLGTTGYLASWPDELEGILATAVELMAYARARCDEHGVELLVVALPSPIELPDRTDGELVQSAMEFAEIEAADVARLTRLRTDFVAALRERGIASLDLYERFASHDEQLYWSQDLHINLAGHRVAAELVEAEVMRLIEK
ncbi:MAG: SGNH/GDSL hydrolase family protein [bacterium]|nr:SGNH/GDSL hydrolase family protein [bacterium]